MKQRFPRLLAAITLVLFIIGAVSALFAQVDQGRITGVVKDQNGAVISGAKVTATNARTGEARTTATNDQGFYTVAPLPPSEYSVRIESPQFAKFEATRVVVNVGREIQQDAVLRVASSAQEVTVVEVGPGAIDTSSARVGVNVNQREVENLPINGRNLSQLGLQAPGSVNSGSGSWNDLRFSGRANQQNAVRYDGIEGSAIIDASPGNLNGEVVSPFRLQSSLENVQEFRLDSNSFPAEYGTGTGGQVSVVTKSGSNAFHGALFEYLRNDALDSKNFFELPGSKGRLRFNQFGGSIGGPLYKNRAFFFGSYEGYRLRSGINFVEAVPSAVAAARAVPAIQPLIAVFRDPAAVTLVGKSTNPDFDIVSLTGRNIVNENSASARFDFKLNNNWSVYTRYFRDQAFNDAPEGVSGRHVIERATPQNGVIALTGILSPSVVNEVKFGYNGALTRVFGKAPVINGIDLSATTINISGSVANTGIAGQGASTGVSIPGGQVRANSASNGRASPYTPYTLSYIDNLTWVHGSHNLKLGGEVRQLRLYTDRLGGLTYTFANLNSFLANTASSIQYLGDVSAPSPFNGGKTGMREEELEFYIGYAQDEWRLRPNLTLSYGLRYEYYTTAREARNLDVLFDPINGVIKPSNSRFYQADPNDWQPRIGISWSPFGTKSALRAGFGINNGPGQVEDTLQPIESDRISSTLSSGTLAYPINTQLLIDNFNNNPTNRQYQPRAYLPGYTVPERIYSYTASWQQELPGRMVATAAYVGSQGRNLFLRSITNRITAVRTNPTPTSNAVVVRQFDIDNGGTSVLRPFAEVDVKTSGGHDSYNALQTQLVRRFERGLTLAAQYTFARSFGNTSGSNEALTAANNAQTLADFDYDEGYNAFDVRHSFNVSALYTLPFGRGKRYMSSAGALANAIFGDWEVGTIVNARSGVPFDLRVTRPDVLYVDAAGNYFTGPAAGRTAVINTPGGGNSRNVRRPDLIPGVDPFLHSGRLLFLNPAAFATPRPGTFGNLQRGMLRGPNFAQADLTLSKRFITSEHSNLEFRTEMFNVFNHANFANPPASLPSVVGTGTNQLQPGQPFTAAAAGTFGILNSTVTKSVGLGTSRQIQFAVRFNF